MADVNKQNKTDGTNIRTGMKQFMPHDCSRDVFWFNVKTKLMTTRLHSGGYSGRKCIVVRSYHNLGISRGKNRLIKYFFCCKGSKIILRYRHRCYISKWIYHSHQNKICWPELYLMKLHSCWWWCSSRIQGHTLLHLTGWIHVQYKVCQVDYVHLEADQ